MPSKANVFIQYGPYKSNGIVDHKEDRLQGLKTFLEEKGHRIIEMKKIPYWDDVKILVNNELVFKTKIQLLDFGGDGQLDKVVKEAEHAITNAY